MSILEAFSDNIPSAALRAPTQIAPLSLALVGDTVYDLYVRTLLVSTRDGTPHTLHLLAAKYVCAAGQAAAFRRIEHMLTEQELGVYKRGRNAHSGTVPKNASVADYHTASGFESLLGWLYLNDSNARLNELMRAAIQEVSP